ncbi:MAG TPA: hypothetical protein VLG92_04175 [Candidatus Saccharimonadia bacterium]|nr:hypothetical protein [Candidatus Saccharimonadia bacterium]
MSRVLAQLLGASEPAFRLQLQQLERAAGMPGADIRLMMEVINNTRDKIRMLGLDPHDTTGPELYGALKSRLNDDETRVRAALNLTPETTSENVLAAVKNHLDKMPLRTQTFVVKQAAIRAILKKLQPKHTMKYLGYRSLDSMLKHEPVPQLLAAVSITESREWNRRRLLTYKKLTSHDFEVRRASFYVPTTKQWPTLSKNHVAHHKHNLLTLPEVGAVVLLPLDHDLPGLAITTLLLAINSLNEMRSLGSYLKLQQVRPDFGEVFATALNTEPKAGINLVGESLPWKMIQWFYGSSHTDYHPEVFEPHVQPEDLTWHEAEDVLAGLHQALEFWQGNQLLALLDGSKAVSLNILDVALNVCNGLDYSQRIAHHMQMGLGRELMARYLHQDNLQAMLLGKLDEQLAPEPAFD